MEIQRESIMTSALRSFFRGLFGSAGFLIGIMIVGIIALSLLGGKPTGDETEVVIAADADGNRDLLPVSAPVILRINIHGEIGDRKLTGSNIKLQLDDSQGTMIKEGRVKGILLHIDSPGGTVVDSDQIYRSLQDYKARYKVPIYAYVDGLCASGAMYIAASSEKIYASPVSVVGSVGVIMGPMFNFYDLMEKLGIKAAVVAEGKNKDMMSPYREWKPDEDASLKNIVENEYQRFVNLVTEARPRLDKEKLINEYGAQIYDSPTGEALGYIDDGDSDYAAALTALIAACGIDEKTEYQVIELEPPAVFWSDFIEGSLGLGKIKWMFDSSIKRKLQYLYHE